MKLLWSSRIQTLTSYLLMSLKLAASMFILMYPGAGFDQDESIIWWWCSWCRLDKARAADHSLWRLAELGLQPNITCHEFSKLSLVVTFSKGVDLIVRESFSLCYTKSTCFSILTLWVFFSFIWYSIFLFLSNVWLHLTLITQHIFPLSVTLFYMIISPSNESLYHP